MNKATTTAARLEKKKAPAPSHQPEAAPAPAPGRVLVVDDHSIVRRGVRVLLEGDSRWEICGEAANGGEGLAQAQQLRPDVILLDLSLPDINGLEVTRQILSAAPQTKILIFTMHDSESLVREALDAGARGFVLKSEVDLDLVAALQAVAAGGLFLGGSISHKVLETYLRGKQKGAVRTGRLTARQRTIVRLLAGGQTNKQVASELGIAEKTVEAHRTIIMRRLELKSFSDLVRYAVREKLVPA